MSPPRTLLLVLGVVVLAVVVQAALLVVFAWMTVVPVSFAGTHVPGAEGARNVVSLHFGPLALAGAALTARIAGGVPLPLTALRGADVEVYVVADEVDPDALLAPPGPEWLPVVRVRDEGDLVGVFARIEGRRIEGLEVIALSDDESLVRVRLGGRVERAAAALVRWGIEQARREGTIRWSRVIPGPRGLPAPPVPGVP